MIVYPTPNEVVAVHARLIAKFGGAFGIRDRAALESALTRPQTGYYADLSEEAAAIRESSMAMEGERPSMASTSGRSIWSRNWRA